MRLINTRTGLFVWVNDPSDVQYAILSHVWVPDEELSYEGLLAIHSAARNHPNPQQYILDTVPAKVREFCAFAQRHGIQFGWLDTCCIDKGSSAELSEAINSMYKWYQMASICIAYLADVEDPLPKAVVPHPQRPSSIALPARPSPASPHPSYGPSSNVLSSKRPPSKASPSWRRFARPLFAPSPSPGRKVNPLGPGSVLQDQFRASRWFKRGWTLQELIAPRSVLFVSRTWRAFGTKESFAEVIEEITGIIPAILTHDVSVDSVSVAMRMSWAWDRVTTREEDRAYSLMGIFGVNLPTIYGEGSFAFIRLQEEILKRVPDATLFLWGRALTQSTEQTRWLRVPKPMGFYRSAAKHFDGLGGRIFHQPSHSSLFAASPSEFQRRSSWNPEATTAPDQLQVMPHLWLAKLLKRPNLPLPEYTNTCYGVRARLPLMWWRADSVGKTSIMFAAALLGCTDSNGRVVALLLGPRDAVHREFKVGFDDINEGGRYLHRIATIPLQWIESDRARITVEEIYIHHADGSWRSNSPPPVVSLVGLAQGTDLQELFDVRLTPWCRSVLECEGFILFEDGWSTKSRRPTPGKPSPSIQTRVFHLVNSRLHIHITVGPCACEGGDAFVRVTVAYRWRYQAPICSSYGAPRELRPAEEGGIQRSWHSLFHNSSTHVATWQHREHSLSSEAFKELNIERLDEAIYCLRLTMQTRQSGGLFLSLTVVDVRDKTQKFEYMQTETILEKLDAEADDVDLEQEARREMAELIKSPDSVCLFSDIGTAL